VCAYQATYTSLTFLAAREFTNGHLCSDSFREFLVPAALLNRYEILGNLSLIEAALLDDDNNDHD